MRIAIGLILLSVLTACPGRSEPSGPDRLDAVAGDGLSLPAGDEVEVVVRVTGGNRPVTGVAVTFEILSGGGTVDTSATGPSDAGGLVRARWRIGSALSTNFLAARTADGLQAIFRVEGVAGPVAVVEKIGDRQFVAAGTTVTVAFRLLDRLGNRVPGAAATCAVVAGGGTAAAVAPADPAWDGACAWTTGATPRVENRLTVSAGTAAPATFTTWTGVPSPLTVRPSSQPHGSRTGVSLSPFGLNWAVVVESAFEIASVTAHAGGLATPLAKGTGLFEDQTWVGFTAGDTLPRGTVVARVTAVDVRGTEGDLYLWFELDRLPVITVAAPIDLSLARAEIAVTATCADDDPTGCTSLTATLGATGQTLTGTSSIAGTFSLAGLPPGPFAVGFTAQDSAGHLVTATRTIWLEPSLHLALLGTAPGEVLDATTTSAFFQVPGEIGIADLSTGVATTTPLEAPVQTGFLWPGGAAFVAEPSLDRAWSWVPGAAPVSIGGMEDGSPLQVAGRFALVTRVVAATVERLLVRIDLASGSEVTAATAPFGFGGVFQADLAANGDVVFVVGAVPDLWRWRDGPTPLVALTSDGQARGQPRTDGARVIYRKELGPADVRAVVWDGVDQPLDGDGCLVEPCLAIAGDWAAFYHPGPSGLGQLWRSGPGGLEQVTFFSQRSTLEALAPDGAVILVNGTTRYRSAPGALDPTPIGAAQGRVVVRDGKALVLLGRSVLEIVP